MYFSAKELHSAGTDAREWLGFNSYPPRTLRQVSRRLAVIKSAILRRDHSVAVQDRPMRSVYVTKWLRPWDVVPKLRNFFPEEGDFGVGIEVEYGFRSLGAARAMARKIKDWKYITLDYEGGVHPIEVTFPPVLYSKIGATTQAVRYCKLLSENTNLLANHGRGLVGTHVNVSKGGRVLTRSNSDTARASLGLVNSHLRSLSYDNRYRYFGRHPYGYGYSRYDYHGRMFLEWKLFLSVADPERLKQYINIAVALTDLVYSKEQPTREDVMEALEYGYNMKKRGKWKSLYTNNNVAA